MSKQILKQSTFFFFNEKKSTKLFTNLKKSKGEFLTYQVESNQSPSFSFASVLSFGLKNSKEEDKLSPKGDIQVKTPWFVTSNGEKIAFTNRFIICMDDNISKPKEQLQKLLSKENYEIAGELDNFNIFLVQYNTNGFMPDDEKKLSVFSTFVNDLHSSKDVKFAHPSFITPVEPAAPLPNLTTQQWATIPLNIEEMRNYVTIDKEIEYETNKDKIKIAILDNGIDKTHPDFNLAPLDEICTVPSRGSTDASQESNGFHGTNVAGIIKAISGNLGVNGIADTLPLIAVKFYIGVTEMFSVVEAINRAINSGARVFNFSWNIIEFPALKNVIKNSSNGIMKNGVLQKYVFCCAAGNYAIENNPKTAIKFPASMTEVICVGAVSQSVTHLGSSAGDSFGSCFNRTGRLIDIVAPGLDIVTTHPVVLSAADNPFILNFKGTSAATPHITAVVAMMLSLKPTLSATQIKNILKTTANKSSPDYDSFKMGAGLLDAEAAARAVILP
jgi:subtilisin family serine protease